MDQAIRQRCCLAGIRMNLSCKVFKLICRIVREAPFEQTLKIIGIGFDQLRQRDQQRRRRQMAVGVSALCVLVLLLAGLSLWALREQSAAKASHVLAEEHAEKERLARRQAIRPD